MPKIITLNSGRQYAVKDDIRFLPRWFRWLFSWFVKFWTIGANHKLLIRKSKIDVQEEISQTEWDEIQTAAKAAQQSQGPDKPRIAMPTPVIPGGMRRR